jgi:hypothetical protein
MHDFDFTSFWEDSDYAREAYVGAPLTDEMIQSVQAELGYKIPKAYLELLRSQNGGIPAKTCHRTSQPTSWAKDHVAIEGIYGLDRSRPSSLCGKYSSKFWMEEWGYPRIGIYFADCPSAGHDMLCLDYRKCGPDGEPAVVHVDQESDYEITLVADNFESFIRGLEDETIFEEKDESEEPVGKLWKCSKCGEELEPQFESCWNCGTVRGDDRAA